MEQYMISNGEIQLEPFELEISDHDYCMPYPMDLVETDHFLKPKVEEESDHYEYQLLEPKSEALFEYPEFLKLEAKLEEPDDSEYTRSMQNSVKLEDIDYCSEDLLESKLEEPDDFEYSEYLKLELVETEHDIGPIRNQCAYSKRRQKQWNRKCAICHELIRPDHRICLVSKNRQMILMLGLVLAKKKSVEEAQQLITGNRLNTCIAHLKDVIDEIKSALDIKSVDELNQCSDEKFQKIMEINKNICPDISFPQFRRALTSFVVKFTESMRSLRTLEKADNFSRSLESKLEELDDFVYSECLKLEPMKTKNDFHPIRKQSTSSKQKQCYHKCSVCRELVCLDVLHCVYSKDRKLILMLGLILKGTKPIEEAHFLIACHGIYTCNVHFKDAVSEIFKALNIKSLKEFLPLGNKNIETITKLLDILRMMCPGFSIYQFHNALIATARMIISGSSYMKAARQERWCMVCHQLENVKGFTDIFSKNRKLILLVGLVVGKKKTMREARQLMNYPSFFCCEGHLTEAAHKILEVLNIKTIDDWHLCSEDNLVEVMNIIWKLCPECSAAQFKIHLTNFLRRFSISVGN